MKRMTRSLQQSRQLQQKSLPKSSTLRKQRRDLFKGIVNEIDRRMENRMRKVAHNERARRFNSRASGTSPFRALFIEGSSDADVSPPHFPLNRIKLFEISSDHLKSLEDAFKLTGIPQTAAQLLKRQERFLNFITE
eukprot:m.148499 g.148499  ORF g.148499 m.148499 type:complete len:136 (-) comp9718_c0_seq9:89-496(-)